MTETECNAHHSVVIIGSGIAGLSAAIYAGRADNDPLVIRGDEPGGQLTLTTDVANYPGFPDGIGGSELVQRMTDQAEQFGATLTQGIVDSVDADDRPFRLRLRDGTVYSADAVIVASGASARTLGIPGEDDLMGYGVSTCATCDGAFFRGEDMVVVGGGDAAFEEASFLTKFADTVHLVHRREGFRAEAHWQNTVDGHIEAGDIELHKNTEVAEVHGSPDEGVDRVTLLTHPDGHPSEKREHEETTEDDLAVGAVFIAIGHTPNTDFLDETNVELDDTGYIQPDEHAAADTATHVPGLFGAGDVVDSRYQQAATAGGMGVKAALDADTYLESRE